MELSGANILITGGTGSWASAFVRHAIKSDPGRLVIFSRDEQKQDQMAREVAHPALRFFLGDVRDQARLEMAMRGIDLVFHAAAMKIIPKCEADPIECIRTNVGGAENVIRAAMRAKVGRVMALSTDKAAQPINLYGASKLAAEKLFLAARNLAGEGGPSFSVVRYGNVVGSRGSVIPLFQRLAVEGKSLPITDIRMTRFWITLDQAVEFVLSSLKLMQGGEIFIPKLPSMRVVDLASALAPGCNQNIIGIRPGEKIHETLLTEDETRLTADMPNMYVIAAKYEGHSSYQEGWKYNSGSNTEWLTVEQLRTML